MKRRIIKAKKGKRKIPIKSLDFMCVMDEAQKGREVAIRALTKGQETLRWI